MCSQCFRCVLNVLDVFSMEAETLLAQVVARAHQLPGVGRGSSPVQGRGAEEGGQGGRGGQRGAEEGRGVSCGIHLPLLTWFLHFSSW